MSKLPVVKQNYQDLVAEGRALTGNTDDDAPWRSEFRAVVKSADKGQTCGKCYKPLKPLAPVWKTRVSSRSALGWGYTMVPTCKRCHDKSARYYQKYPYLTGDKYKDPKPCEGCGRPVHNPRDYRYRQHTVCCRRCQIKVSAAKHSALAREQRAEERTPRKCAGCDTEFTPTRTDARYCTTACKQRAYRGRVTGTKKGASPFIKKRNGARVTVTKKPGARLFKSRNGARQ